MANLKSVDASCTAARFKIRILNVRVLEIYEQLLNGVKKKRK